MQPDEKGNWINMANTDFETLLPLCAKEVKAGKSKEALSELFSLGGVTARDEWVYDDIKEHLKTKVNFLIDAYNNDVEKLGGKFTRKEVKNEVNYSIKWTRAVVND